MSIEHAQTTNLDYAPSVNGVYVFDNSIAVVFDPNDPFTGLPGDVFSANRCFFPDDVATLDQSKLKFINRILNMLFPDIELPLLVEYYIGISRYRRRLLPGIVVNENMTLEQQSESYSDELTEYVLVKLKNVKYPITFSYTTGENYLYFGFLCTHQNDVSIPLSASNLIPLVERITLVTARMGYDDSIGLQPSQVEWFHSYFDLINSREIKTREQLNSEIQENLSNVIEQDMFRRRWWCKRPRR